MFDKLEKIRKALGSDRVFDVIQEVLPGVNLADLIVEAIAGRCTLEEIAADLERVPDQEVIRRVKQAMLESLAIQHIDVSSILREERKARETRLVPEYIEAFFERACRFLGLRLEKRADGSWRLNHVPADLRRRSAKFQDRYGQVQESYPRFTFYKEEARAKGIDFVAPGHPLLETVIEEVLKCGEEDLRQGATFTDPRGKLHGRIWFLTASINDGNGEPVLKRLVAVYEPHDGAKKELIFPAILWDLIPEPASSPPKGGGLLEKDEAEGVRAFVVKEVMPEMLSEVEAERARQAEIRRKYGLRSLEKLIGEVEHSLLELGTRQAKGEDVTLALREAERRRDELRARRRQLEDRIRRETSLIPGEIEVLSAVAVVPVPAGRFHADREIERIGMEVVLDYERRHGRTPEDVSAQNLGYDIRSVGPDGVRYIEVKARAGAGPVALTKNEWLMGQRLGDEYWLYIVEQAASQPKLYLVQNPTAKLEPREVVKTVQYVVSDWKRHASQGA